MEDRRLDLVVSSSYQDLLDSQKEVLRSQIDQLRNIVVAQCNHTGVNPLSQEMAAGALSVKIGKRPRDLLNPKVIKYMQLVFSVKDAISKKEAREISALFGVTVTQVREFFNSQRSRVRKFVRMSREKAVKSRECNEVQRVQSTSDLNMPIDSAPLNSLAPPNAEEGPSNSAQDDVLSGVDESDKHILENIFTLMRKEETFSSQVKLMRWMLQIRNSSLLDGFLLKGGLMILATWLSQAATEEQTSVLRVILKLLCHLPLKNAPPVHMSAILQSVNRLRFYRTSDISNNARILLFRWSKMLTRSQGMKKPNGVKSSTDAQDEMLLKQSIVEVMGTESWDSKVNVIEDASVPVSERSDGIRKLDSSQPLRMLTASADDSNKKSRVPLSSHTRERRTVLLVEQPGQKWAGRSIQVARPSPSSQSRPLSADDIQKAKMRAQYMSKYGKTATSSDSPQAKLEDARKCNSSENIILHSVSKLHYQPKVGESKKLDNIPSKIAQPEASRNSIMSLDEDEPAWKKCKRVQIAWHTPPEMKMSDSWRIGVGQDSKEVELQKNRIRREREIIYRTVMEIPLNPKEPWDREMDYDDSLTPEIPTEQLPDADVDADGGAEAVASFQENTEITAPAASSSSQIVNGKMPELDLQLLAVLLENPDLVFALTDGQAGNLSSEETVRLLDMIKANGMNNSSSLTSLARKPGENIEVSLPSPTPSRDAVTSGLKPEFSKDHTFGLNPLATGEALHRLGAGVAPVISEERLSASSFGHPNIPVTTMLAPEQPQAGLNLPTSSVFSQQTVHQMPLLDQQRLFAHQQNIQIPGPSLRSNVNHISQPRPASPSLVGGQAPTMLHADSSPILGAQAPGMPTRADIVMNAPERHVGLNYPSPTPAQSLPPLHPQTAYVSEEPIHFQSRRTMQDFHSTSHYQNNPNPNYHTGYGGGPIRPPLQQGSWNRDDLGGESGFESWSPDNSPFRSHDHNPRWNYAEPRMNMDGNHRMVRPVSRNPGSHSGHYDPGTSGNRNWNDRRR